MIQSRRERIYSVDAKLYLSEEQHYPSLLNELEDILEEEIASYEAMPEPRLVMACGDCAINGGVYGESYAIVGPAEKVVPVDIYVPGCPPRPNVMIAGLIAAADMLAEKLK